MTEDKQPSVTVRPASDGQLCSDREHAGRGTVAAVVITFGRMPFLRWSDCSGRTFAFCPPCWDRTRDVAEQIVPDIEIRAETVPAASPVS